jgi:metal-responsive CopG/Arc/MetJ family transcriptional regulator
MASEATTRCVKTTINICPTVLKHIDEIATNETRNRSKQIEVALKEHIERHKNKSSI